MKHSLRVIAHTTSMRIDTTLASNNSGGVYDYEYRRASTCTSTDTSGHNDSGDTGTKVGSWARSFPDTLVKVDCRLSLNGAFTSRLLASKLRWVSGSSPDSEPLCCAVLTASLALSQ
jgi:hypothetical protein